MIYPRGCHPSSNQEVIIDAVVIAVAVVVVVAAVVIKGVD
jgi:hypothetical protein